MSDVVTLLAALAVGLCTGLILGAALEAWGWRLSAGSHHQSHKSAGRWFTVFPQDGPTRITRKRKP